MQLGVNAKGEMMKVIAFVFLATSLLPATLNAQTSEPLTRGTDQKPPQTPAGPVIPQSRFLFVTKEWVKPGQMSAVLQADRERAKALRAANWKRPVLGFTSVTGPDQVIYLSFFDDLGPIQTERDQIAHNPALKAVIDKSAQEGGNEMSAREDIVNVFHEDLTYRPSWDWSKTRCLDMLRIHLRGGKGAEYIENRKMTLESHDRGALDTHVFLYSVVSGTPSWTWFVIRPMPALDHLDMLRREGFGEPFTVEEKKRQIQLFAESALSEEEEYFCADPSISNAPASWAGDSDSFWNPK